MDNMIDYYRKLQGLTIQQLADQSGMSRVYLQQIKAGKKRLNSDTISRLAKALKCYPAELIAEPSVMDSRKRDVDFLMEITQQIIDWAKEEKFYPSGAEVTKIAYKIAAALKKADIEQDEKVIRALYDAYKEAV